jgi:hypothetical protein
MYYTASSVKKEIETKKALTINGDLQCPQNTGWIQTDGTPCLQVPTACIHTQKHTCKQRIHIYEQGIKLAILTFYFTISQSNLDGRIDSHDQQLERLIRHGKISEKYSVDVMQFDPA